MLQLTTLFLLFFISCQKDNLEEFKKDTPTPIPKNFSTPDFQHYNLEKIEDESFKENSQIILDVEKAFRELTFRSIFQASLFPEVYGLQNSSATPRTGCPCATNETTAGASGGNVHTITLDYGTGCTTSSSTRYQGIVTITLNGDLNTDGTTVNILLDPDFKINSENDLDGNIQLTYEEDFGEVRYFIDDINLTNTNTVNNAVTAVSPTVPPSNGEFYVFENTKDDVPNSPLNILNDTIQYGGCFKVHCPNNETLRSCTFSPIFYTIGCGVPYDGELHLDTLISGENFDDLPLDGGSYGNMNFAFPKIINNGICDDSVTFFNTNTSLLDTLFL